MKNFMKREDGPTTVEYALLLALIVCCSIIGVQYLGSKSKGTSCIPTCSCGKNASCPYPNCTCKKK